MDIKHLKSIFRRDLTRLKQELEAYRNESAIWETANEINNSAGTLGVHVIGNLNAYIGAELGGTGYIRDRDGEFSPRRISRREIGEQIEQTIDIVEQSLDRVSESQLDEEFPVPVSGRKQTTRFMLMHLITHLSYHLGQVSYHRRLLDNPEKIK